MESAPASYTTEWLNIILSFANIVPTPENLLLLKLMCPFTNGFIYEDHLNLACVK